MKKYIVEVTTHENYCTDNWDNDWNPEKYVEAEEPEEAVDITKDYLNENGEDVEKVLFRVAEMDEYGCNGEWFLCSV